MIELSQGKDHWLAVLNVVMNLHIPQKEENVSHHDDAICSISCYI